MYQLFYPNESFAEYRQRRLNLLYGDVPDGGDAAFAAAACELRMGWGNGLARLEEIWEPLDDRVADRVASTPNVIRGMGRDLSGHKKSKRGINSWLRQSQTPQASRSLALPSLMKCPPPQRNSKARPCTRSFSTTKPNDVLD